MNKKEYKYQLNTNYILNDEPLVVKIMNLIKTNKLILLVAPQGTGKTNFFKNKLKDLGNILLVSPTKALAEQTATGNIGRRRTRYAIEHGIDDSKGFIGEVVWSNKFSDTGASANRTLDSFEPDIIIVDEIHKWVEYSAFAYKQVVALITLIERCMSENKKIILTTATPEILSAFEGISFYDRFNCSIIISADKKYVGNIRLLNKEYYSSDSIVELLKSNHQEGKLQIGIINNKRIINKVIKDLNVINIKAIGITSDDRTKDECRSFEDAMRKDTVTTDYSVFIATSYADVGLNFKVPNISNIYYIVDSTYYMGSFTSARQFMARVRNTDNNNLPTLFLMKPENTYRENILYNNFCQNELFEELSRVAKQCLNEYKKGLISMNAIQYIDGIYKTDSLLWEDKYDFSPITLKYHVLKLFDKYSYEIHGNEYLAELFKCDDISNYNSHAIVTDEVWGESTEDEKKAVLGYIVSMVNIIENKNVLINKIFEKDSKILANPYFFSTFIEKLTNNEFSTVSTSSRHFPNAYKIIVNV